MNPRSLVVAFGLAMGCSLQTTERTECESNTECRAAFGPTSVCGDAGYCDPLSFPERCSPFPELLESDPELSNAVLYGVMMDRGLEADRRAERAAKLAVSLANQNGGLNEGGGEARRFGLIVCDYQTDATGASGYRDSMMRVDASIDTARFLVDDLGVPAIVGPTRSTETELVYVDVARPGGTLLLSPGANASVLAQLAASDAGLLWRTVPPENAVVAKIAQSIVDRGINEIFVLAQQGVGAASATLLQNLLADQFEQGAAIPEVSVQLYAPEGADLVSAINEAAETGADEIVFLADHPLDSVRFLEVASGDDRFSEKSFILDAAADDPAILAADAAGAFGGRSQDDGPVSYRVRIVRTTPPSGATTSNFRNQYRAEYGNEDPLPFPVSPATWDAMWMLMLATAAPVNDQSVLGGVGTVGLGLRALSDTARTTKTSLDPSNWRVAQELLRNGETLNVEGASGSLDYDLVSSELVGVAEVDVIELVNGQWTFTPAPETELDEPIE